MGTLSVDKILKTSEGAAEFTLPATDGTAGQVWQTDGSGQLSVATVGSSGIATDAVGTSQIAADAVTASEIAGGAVGASEIADTSITPTQIASSTFLANRNRIINGNFDVWQRGTSFAGVTATGYQADRWEVQPAAGCTMTISRQAFTAGQTDVPYEPSYFLRADITTAGSANSEISQKIEDVRTFAGQTIVASFYAKSTTGTQTLNCRFHQDFGSGGSTRVTTGVTQKVLTSSWQKFTFTLTLGSISGKTIGTSSYLAFNFYWANSSTSNDVDLAQVQVEAGSVATPFEYKTFDQELEACLRYYQKSYEYGTALGSSTGNGAVCMVSMANTSSSTANSGVGPRWPKEMRTQPTVTIYSGLNGTSGELAYTRAGIGAASVAASTGGLSTKAMRVWTTAASSLGTNNAVEQFYHYAVDAEIS